jgi:hypothetical protein
MFLPRSLSSLSVFSAISLSLMSSAAFSGSNTYRYTISSLITPDLLLESDLPAGEGSGESEDDKVYSNWLDFYHDNQRHLTFELESDLNGESIDLGGLQLSSSSLPDVRYTYSNIGSIDVSGNNFSDLNFLYPVSNVSGSIDVSGNTGLKSIDYLSHLNLTTNGSFVIFDSPSHYTNLMDGDSKLCTAIISGEVLAKSVTQSGLIDNSAGDFCTTKSGWIGAYNISNYYYYKTFTKDSQLLNQKVYLSGNKWSDNSIPDYNYPVNDVKSLYINGTELTNFDFMSSIKTIKYLNEDVTISNNPNLVDVSGLKNTTVSQSYYYSSGYKYYDTSVTIYNNPLLESLVGMPRIYNLLGRHSSSRLSITNNPKLTSLPNLTHTSAGSMDFRGNANLTDFSFLSGAYFSQSTSSTGTSLSIYVDSNNMLVKPHAEDGNLCSQLIDSKIRINGSSGVSGVRRYCDLNPWPNMFTKIIYKQIYGGWSNYKWAIKDSDLNNYNISISSIDLTGLIPSEKYPVSSVRSIALSNVKGLIDLSFLSTVTNMFESANLTLSQNPDLVSLDGIQNIASLDYGQSEKRITVRVKRNPLLTDISAFGSFKGLYRLYVTNNPSLKSLSGLEGLEKAQFIYLNNNGIEDISALSNVFKNPVANSVVDLSENNIKVVPTIGNNGTILPSLNLLNNDLVSIEGVRGRSFSKGSAVVFALNLRGNLNLHDLSPLSDMPPGGDGTIYIGQLSQYTTLLDKDGAYCQRALYTRPSVIFSYEYADGSTGYLYQPSHFTRICK